ncbi:beta-ketoacyl-[acyl-carrier-protein] synthase family protein [Chelatococcus reniformis]|uniref:3-oxoacyl-[acyl-carrier-protein] synthase 2 n=1 Tax=Chelatococcus reniformis TaxID=1494448 RepID=A0A916TWV5_9HYPH|nr:beta-ketoacyl-[acyl-carrier-protein] synthase family protein [Chelatococcus reniformis]GGC47795.1 3-oxoacyl-[acyl-carrier-protein] synthase 2 [Chelatococcus reniformis]
MLDVAITGTGIVSAVGCNTRTYHQNLMAGETAIRQAPWADGQADRPSWWAIIRDFEPRDWMDDKVESGTDMFAQFALAASRQAIDQAGLGQIESERTGVVHGTSMGGTRALMRAQHLLDARGPTAIPRKTEIQIYPNMAASQIAMEYGIHGPSLTVTTACASSLDAIGTAAHMIASGRADVIIAGGTDGGLAQPGGTAEKGFVPALYYSSTLYGMVAPSNDPRRAMMPFDVKRSGIVVGEGSAMFVLERGDRARARGADILGYVRGYGSLADAYHPSSPEPSGRWEARAMQLALADAGMEAGQVDALIAHATGTPKGDTAEILAINAVHGRRPTPLPVASVKGHVGHSGASSGGMAVVTGLLGMREDRFLFTANTDEPDPAAEFDVVIKEPRRLAYGTLQVNAFGFGGQNASIVVTRN